MKKLNRNSGVALLRGVTFLGGIMATMCFALFTESWNSCFAVALCGLTAVVLIDENIKALSHG